MMTEQKKKRKKKERTENCSRTEVCVWRFQLRHVSGATVAVRPCRPLLNTAKVTFAGNDIMIEGMSPEETQEEEKRIVVKNV
jgi:hypothetical protein